MCIKKLRDGLNTALFVYFLDDNNFLNFYNQVKLSYRRFYNDFNIVFYI